MTVTQGQQRRQQPEALKSDDGLLHIELNAESNSKPNVIFTLVDDWGYNDVGYHNALNEGIIR